MFLPLALIWAVVTTLRSVRSLRAGPRVCKPRSAMRAAYVSNQQAGTAMKPSVDASWMKLRRQPGTPKPRWPVSIRAVIPA